MFDKKVLVAGAGISGISATDLLISNNVNVILYDEDKNGKVKKEEILKKSPDTSGLEIITGKFPVDIIDEIELMVISPGIPTDEPFVNLVRERNIAIWGEIELAYYFDNGIIAAITGTNGKTTTTTLVGEILKSYNDNTKVVGNIGIPYTKVANSNTKDTIVVAEISSFQLETISTFRPKVSAILNITPDHLNRHYTFKNYADTKVKITMNQTVEDYCIINKDDESAFSYASKIPSKVILFSRKEVLEEGVYVKDNNIYITEKGETKKVLSLQNIKLLGEHNVENYLAAVGISYYMGADINTIERVCCDFGGVEHRIEYVDTINGVSYYNDSKATNPDAAIKGIKAMISPTLLIGGGFDKGNDYDDWINSFDTKVKYLILLGETADDIEKSAIKNGFNNIVKVNNLEDAVSFAASNSQDGDAVLLSPACASWGMFDNYEQRGNIFKKYVKDLKG